MKAAGCMLILFIFTVAGMYVSSRLEKRVRQLKELEKAVLFMKREIDYQLAPLGIALVHTGEKAGAPWKQFFLKTGERILAGKEENKIPGECFEEEMKNIAPYHPWEKDLEILLSLGKNLGELDKKMQLAQILIAEEEVMQAIQNAKEEYSKKGKLYQTLGVCMGILGVILLI